MKSTFERNLIRAFVGAGLGAIIVFGYYNLYLDRKYTSLKFNKEYSFKVEKIKVIKGAVYFNDSLHIGALSMPDSPSHIWLWEFLKVNDSILKKENSSIVIVKRNNQEFHFGQ